MITRVMVLLLLLASPALGQTQLGLGAGFGNFSGDDFDGSEAGLTVGGHLLFGVSPNFQLGGAVDYSSYGAEGTEETVSQIDVDAVARYLFPGDAARFYLGGKLGYSRQSVDVLDVSASNSGFAAGPTLGLHLPAGSIGVELGADLFYHSYGDVEAEGLTLDGTDTTGFRFVARAGVSIPLGG